MKKDTIVTIIGLLTVIFGTIYVNKKYIESQPTETKSAEGCGCGNGAIKVY